jgi:Holliday junction resolvase-like predicted endonuclease
LTKKERGKRAESWVAWHREQNFSEVVVIRNLRTPFAEVDLVLRHVSSKQIHIIEVKRYPPGWDVSLCLTRLQLLRLRRAQEYLSSSDSLIGGRPEIVRLSLAVVVETNRFDFEVQYYSLDH